MKKIALLRLSAVFLLSLFFTGCASVGSSPAVLSDANIMLHDSRKGQLRAVRAYEISGNTVVQGSVARATSSRILNGHVHVDMLDRAGTLIASAVTDYRLNRSGSRVARSAPFRAELPASLLADTTVVVRHHDAPGSEHGINGTIIID